MIWIILSAITTVIGFFLFGHTMLLATTPSLPAYWVLSFISGCLLITTGITTFAYNLGHHIIRKRANFIRENDFFLYTERGGRSNYFDFEAYLVERRARDILIHRRYGTSVAECKIEKHRLRLETWLNEGEDGGLIASTTFTNTFRGEKTEFTLPAKEALVHDGHTCLEAVFVRPVFERWREEVERLAGEREARKYAN